MKLAPLLGSLAVVFTVTVAQADTAPTRSYTAVSNIMKTKHDTVKNSISNVR